MKVLHVVPTFYPAHVYGGPTYSLLGLCSALVRHGVEVRVLTTDANGTHSVLNVEKGREVELTDGLRVRYCRRVAPQAVSPALLRLLSSFIRWADVVHLTAVYSFPTIPTLLACRILDKPAVWSPRGALQRWDRSTRLLLKAAWEKVCAVVAPKKIVLHATCEEERQESLERFPGMEMAVIPNGVEIPEKVIRSDGSEVLRLLYLGRIHPKKGIENLLTACRLLHDRLLVPLSLTMVGAGDVSYTKTIQLRIEQLQLSRSVKMVGEVVGEAKRGLFEEADIVVVPSHTENFAMVVAEALAHGVPVIASRGAPWQRVEEMGCGLWVENTPDNLAEAVEKMSHMPLREMGQKGREWMEREFSWNLVAREMSELYRSLIGRGDGFCKR